MDPEWFWVHRHQPFVDSGSDIFLAATPGGTIAYVASAEANWQIVQRRTDFPKPLDSYHVLNIYGRNVVTTEGLLWRHHRKITAPPFAGEKNNALVWKESIYQTGAMLRSWLEKDGVCDDLQQDTMRLPLHIISRAGFGVRLAWPGQEHKPELQKQNVDGTATGSIIEEKELSSFDVPAGHSMSYQEAISVLLHNILLVLLIPKWLLSRLPIESLRKVHQSYVEWGMYMRELYEKKKLEIRDGQEKGGVDLMGTFPVSLHIYFNLREC